MSTKYSEFLGAFPVPLHHRQPSKLWVLWSQYENNSSSADRLIHEKIKYAFSNFALDWWFFAQFWAPKTIGGGKRVLSTSGQPFAISHPSNEFTRYRLYSERYQYIIDVNNLDIEPDHLIMSGGPATVFLRRLPCVNELEWIPSDSCDQERLNFSIMIPICFPSQSFCIGVLEFTLDYWTNYLGRIVLEAATAIKEAGLDVFLVANLMPGKTLYDLKPTTEKIEDALKIICGSHNLALAQVWISFEDKKHMPSSSSLEGIQTNQVSALKLTGYLYAVRKSDSDDFEKYYSLCDIYPHGVGEEVALKTLQDYESRYVSKICENMFVDWDREYSESSALVICLRSIDTGYFDYAFEFIWIKHTNYVSFLEALLLTLKRCLPSFKFASGAELGDELEVLVVDTSTEYDETSETEKFKICQGKRSLPVVKALEEGNKSMAVDCMAPSEMTCCKTTPKVLHPELIEKQFGKTMKEAANNLNVSESTLKRKLRKLGITKWPGPNFVRRKTNELSIIQIDTNEDSRTIHESSIFNIKQNTLIIKAKYANDIIKFSLSIWQATFATVEEEIGKKFKLCPGTYKLKYQDEVGEWILLTKIDNTQQMAKQNVPDLEIENTPPTTNIGPATTQAQNGLNHEEIVPDCGVHLDTASENEIQNS
ncbi:protein NLP6-like [Bidens hawaiensis]|uniref:protein NLP6-like n=1 Tax=Bidens hawaiensis TaxID=980011 RepID=UPI00404AED5B